MTNTYGNYVMQTALKITKNETNQQKLISAIEANLPKLTDKKLINLRIISCFNNINSQTEETKIEGFINFSEIIEQYAPINIQTRGLLFDNLMNFAFEYPNEEINNLAFHCLAWLSLSNS